MNTIAWEEALTKATRDIHARCPTEVTVLWDDGSIPMVGGTHTARIWNGLGSFELEIEHHDLMVRGEAYRRFLDQVEAMARRKLTLA